MYYKMVVITVEKYANAGVHTITVENNFFWGGGGGGKND